MTGKQLVWAEKSWLGQKTFQMEDLISISFDCVGDIWAIGESSAENTKKYGRKINWKRGEWANGGVGE